MESVSTMAGFTSVTGMLRTSATCIAMAARAIPNDAELTNLAEIAASTVKEIKALKPEYGDQSGYLTTLYAALLHQNGGARNSQVDDALRQLMAIHEASADSVTRLIAQGWLFASPIVDREVSNAIAAHKIRGDDNVVLTSLLAKRRGGQLWQTFREEMPSIVGKQPLNGHVVVLVNRLGASPLGFGSK